MMTKTILFSDNTRKEMTFEEVIEQFAPMVIKAMKRANNKFIFNAVEEEDFKQELNLELWRAYEQYEPDQGNCFTTYLYYKLQKGVRNATYHKYSLKNQGVTISMNASVGDDDLKLEDMFATEDNSIDNLAFKELTAIIQESIEPGEEDLLKVILNKKSFSVQNYADKYGITRQAANQRVNKLKKKLQKVVAEQYLEIE
ncbi:sigma-70 family RNA polymerase sigma factor [Geobacillus phage GR1]|nr:sigma-70 family RNA polymerase sigma factor [Geobacillus phage GR1]